MPSVGVNTLGCKCVTGRGTPMSFPIYGIKDFETAIWQRFISTLALREKERETLLGTRREDLPLVSFSTGLSSVVSPPDAIWEELYYFFSIFLFVCLQTGVGGLGYPRMTVGGSEWWSPGQGMLTHQKAQSTHPCLTDRLLRVCGAAKRWRFDSCIRRRGSHW